MVKFDDLAEKIASHNERAFNVLYEKLNRLVFSVSFSILRDRGLAQDIMQETFQTVWDKTGEFRGTGYKSWILTIAKNKSLNLLKKRSHESEFDFAENPNMFPTYDVNDKVEINDIMSLVAKVLDEEELKIVMYRNSGVKMKEISEMMGIPRGTASWKYSVALEKLKEYFSEKV